jgi:DNA-binding transcriptional ArsR family regulator
MPRRNGSEIALLADPTRRHIIAILAIRPQRPSFLARQLSVSRPAITRQLRLLEAADLVVAHEFEIDRRGVLYSVPWRHGAITAWLAGTEIGRSIIDPLAAAGVPRTSQARTSVVRISAEAEDIAAKANRGRSKQPERLDG